MSSIFSNSPMTLIKIEKKKISIIKIYNVLCVVGLSNPVSKTIYDETNQKIEKRFKILDVVLLKATPACVTLPMLIINLVTYFTTDIGSDALELPFQMW